jgi:predicted unusual protein kinase regulating ubiquinone biosynthesis (AarF/ABC1/UbiB family)
VLASGGVGFLVDAVREPAGPAAARRLRRAFEALGPTYVKLGQLVASSPGLFPDVLAEEFRACLDRVPAIPWAQVVAVVTAELGAPPAELFAHFAPEPLAAASIAQVHAATLADGAEVVVKVQRPGLRSRLDADLVILHRAARLLERTSARGRMANPVAVVEDFAASLAQELDFLAEGRSMERFGANLRSFGANDRVRVPAVHWPLTTARVLTMERIRGVGINELTPADAAGLDLDGALRAAVRAWLEAALEHGFFHGDVHAGNLMIDDDGRIIFLDFGICGELEDRARHTIRRVLPALLVQRDYHAVATAIYELGAILRPADLDHAADDIATIVEPLLTRPLSEISYGAILVEVIRIGTRYEVRLPRELVLVAKQLVYFERYGKLMAPDWAVLNDPELLRFLFQTLAGGDADTPGDPGGPR